MFKSRYYITLQLSLLSFCLFSCSSETTIEPLKSNSVVLRYAFENISPTAIALESESKINDALILFYNQEGRYVDYAKVDDINRVTTMLSFTLPPNVKENESYRLLVVANYVSYELTDNLDQFTSDNSHLYLEEMKAKLSLFTKSGKHIVNGALPFGGIAVDINGEETLFNASQSGSIAPFVILKLHRAVARIDLINKAANFKLKSAKVANYRDGGYVFSSRNQGDLIAKADNKSVESFNNTIVGGLYAFPNFVQKIGANDELTTCLVVCGSFDNGKDTYYRANIGKNDGVQSLKANTQYTITITGVFKDGAESEEEALYHSDLLMEYELDRKWINANDENLQIDDNGNYLGLSSSYLLLNGASLEITKIKVNANSPWSASFLEESSDRFCEIVLKTSNSLLLRTIKSNSGTPRNNHLHIELDSKEFKQEVVLAQMKEQATLPTGYYDVVVEKNKSENQLQVIKVSAMGETYTFRVTTKKEGSWSVSDATGDNPLSPIDGSISGRKGLNGSDLMVTIPKNTKGSKRTASLILESNIVENGAQKTLTYTLKFEQE